MPTLTRLLDVVLRRHPAYQPDIARLNAALFDANEALARVYSTIVLDAPVRDPDYGWPTGEHIPDTLADEIIAAVNGEEVRRLLQAARHTAAGIRARAEEQAADIRAAAIDEIRTARCTCWIDNPVCPVHS